MLAEKLVCLLAYVQGTRARVEWRQVKMAFQSSDHIPFRRGSRHKPHVTYVTSAENCASRLPAGHTLLTAAGFQSNRLGDDSSSHMRPCVCTNLLAVSASSPIGSLESSHRNERQTVYAARQIMSRHFRGFNGALSVSHAINASTSTAK